jgi:hypothetical protein
MARLIFAATILVRPVLIAPMAPGGPLGRSELLPVAIGGLFVAHGLLAVGVAAGSRPFLALALVSAVAAVPLALLGAVVGLALPWPLVLAGYNVLIAIVGVRAWRQQPERA